MGASVEPEKVYSPDNPFAKQVYSPDNPFAGNPRTPTKLEIARRNASMPHPEDTEPDEPSYATKVLGGLASFGRDIPGVEAIQAMAGMKGLDLTKSSDRSQFGDAYKTSLNTLRGAEDAAPKSVTRLNSIAGGTIAALAGPKGGFADPLMRKTGAVVGSAAAQGARYGAAQGLLSADPNQSGEDRLLAAGKKGAIAGAISGLVGDVPGKVAKVVKILGSRTPGAAAIGRRGDIAVADQAYPQMLAQAKGATHPDVTAILDSPYVKPYADAARESPSLQGADDATILHEVYKTLGTRQRALADRTERAANYLAGPEREIQDIELVKKGLRDAADKIMPDYSKTVAQHAKLSDELEALKDTKDATARIMNKGSVAGKNLETNSPEAFKLSILKMKKEQAEAAREAMLGQLHEKAGDYLNGKPWKGFGVPAANAAINRVSPYLQMVDKQITGPAGSVPWWKLDPTDVGPLGKGLSVGLGAHGADR